MASQAEIEAWSRNIGLQSCIGVEFNAEKGRLPNSIPELEQWGDSTQRRKAGVWTCKGITPGTGTPPGGTTPSPGAGSLTAFLQANPVLALGGAAIVLMLLLKK